MVTLGGVKLSAKCFNLGREVIDTTADVVESASKSLEVTQRSGCPLATNCGLFSLTNTSEQHIAGRRDQGSEIDETTNLVKLAVRNGRHVESIIELAPGWFEYGAEMGQTGPFPFKKRFVC